MELLTTKTLWEGYDPSAEALDVTVARVTEEDGYVYKKVYFTARTFASGHKTRVCASICIPTKKTKRAVLLISDSDQSANHDELADIVSNGFIAMSVDINGRTPNSCGTMYAPEVSYCNAEENNDIFYFGSNTRQSKVYEQSLSCMRAVTYLLQEEKVQAISVVTIGDCSVLGAVVCANDKRVTNGAFLFGRLHIDYPEQGATQKLTDQLAYDELDQAWTMALAPQSYATSIDIPIYVVNSVNSLTVDIMEVNKMYYRVNDQSRLLIVPDTFDCLQNQYLNSVIAWCKGANVDEECDIEHFAEGGDHFVKIVTPAKLKDVSLWYCTNADARAKQWVQAKVTQGEGYYLAKINLPDANCNVVAFAEIQSKVTLSTSILEFSVKDAPNYTPANGIVFTGEGDYQLIAVGDPKAWLMTGVSVKRKKGYLGIVGAEGKCLATFGLNSAVRKTQSHAISFDICSTAQEQLTVAVVCNFGYSNEIYVAKAQLVGDGKWQRITVDTENFNSVVDGKHMTEDKKADLLVLKCNQSFLVNNIILV